jgi:hypothetical protein
MIGGGNDGRAWGEAGPPPQHVGRISGA